MRKRIFTIIILFIFGNTSPIFAQNSNFTFEKLPAEIGWTDNSINDVIQDHRSFLWLATWAGLKRYDGYSIKTYRQELGKSDGLKSNKITCLFEDSKNRLWIGTNYTGLYQYDRATDGFVQYAKIAEDMNSLSNNNVWAISEDSDGFIWIGTEKGLNRFHPETKSFVHFEKSETDELSLSYDFVTTIGNSKEGDLWVGCEIGLNRLVKGEDGKSDYFIRYSLAPEGVDEYNFLQHNYISRIVPSQYEPNTFWVATSIGLKKVKYFPHDLSKIEFENFYADAKQPNKLSHRFVTDLYEDDEGKRLWIGTYDGLNVFDIENKKFNHFFYEKNKQNTLSNNVVKSLFKDRSGILWIGTDKGINNINLKAKPFKSIQLEGSGNFSNNIIACISPAKSRDGFWIGTKGSGLHFLPMKNGMPNPSEISYHPFKINTVKGLSRFVSNVKVDDEGYLWITTEGAGLLKMKEEDIFSNVEISNAIQFTMEDELVDDYVMTLEVSSDGKIWFGYWDNGIGQYDPATNTFMHFNFTSDFGINFQEYPIVHLKEIEENGITYLWVGTRGGGLYKVKFENRSKQLDLIKQYNYKNGEVGGLSSNSINCLYFLEKSTPSNSKELWIGTEYGINRLDLTSDSITYFFERDGLANGIIQSILSDKKGNIWVSTQQGISCIHPDGNNQAIQNFDAYDGLKDNFFYDESAAIAPSGHIFFGGVKGINYFMPEAIKMNLTPPQISITDFQLAHESVPIGKLASGRTILQKSIAETKEINLTHRDNVIAFEFVGLQFGEPQKIKYAHKLEGFNEDWVYTDASQRIVQYTNLPYDNFKFMVKAANADGLWSESVELNLNIAPPFWLTNWAYVFYLILFSALFYGVLRVTKMRTEFAHSLQLEKVEREKLEEVNKMKLQFFTNISHELRTPLTLIISPLEQFVKEQSFEKKLHKSMVRMYHNANRLLTMINQLLDIRKSEAGLMKLKVAEGNFVKFANEIILSFKGLAKQRNIKLNFLSEEEKIPLWYDRDQMEKVLFNLLSNALKFTPEGGRIEVHILSKSVFQKNKNEQKEFLTIQVRDTGSGIPENQREHIFDRFYQVEKKSEEARKGGTGIGLALTKSIVKGHHGKIWVENNEIGEGSTFVVLLPLGDSHFSEKEKIPSFQDSETITNYLNSDLLEGENKLLNVSNNEKVINSSKEKPLVLIVEDNADIRAYLKESLESTYRIIQAEDGASGLEKATDELPDLILADISMPKMDGIEMCSRLKSALTTSHIPIILLTARTSLIFKIDGVEKGADDYVTKPFSMQFLEARIKNLINSRNQLKQKFAKKYDLSPSVI